MGLRGPAKKPNALEVAEGMPGHRGINSESPEFPDGEPDMPVGLSGPARKIWQETVPMLLTVPGLLSAADGPVLGDFCEVHAQRLAVERAMRVRQSQAVAAARAAAKKNRTKFNAGDWEAIAVEAATAKSGEMLNRLRHRENVLRRELGLSPSARSSIRIAGAQSPGRRDAEDAALFGRGPRLVAV